MTMDLKLRFNLSAFLLSVALCLGVTVISINSRYSVFAADPTSPQTGQSQQQNDACVAQGGVLGVDPTTGRNTCTICDGSNACITKDSANGQVRPLYYPAACRAVGGSYSGTNENGVNTVRCQRPDNSFVEIKLQPGALPLPTDTIQSTKADSKLAPKPLKADCQAVNLDKNNCKIIRFIVDLIRVLSGLVGIVVVIMLAYSGIQYSMAKDNPQAVTAAKERIKNTLIALLAYLFVFSFLQWVVPGGVI